MLPTAIPDSATMTFRATGALRFIHAVFLGVWLTFWAIGEAVALAVLALLIGSHFRGNTAASDWASAGSSSYVMLFLLVWVALWTVGGVAAATSFLRSVAGEDRLSAVPEGIAIVRRAGPFRRRKTFDRGTLKRVRLRGRDRTLVVDAPAGTEVLTDLGTREERDAALAWLQQHLRLPVEHRFNLATPPPRWHVSVEPTGGTCLVKPAPHVRRKQALVMWIITAITSIGWISPVMNAQAGAMTLAAFALSMLLAAGAAWLTWGHSEWTARSGSLVFRRHIGNWMREERFEPGQLEVEHSTDSDGDDHYRLLVRGAEERHRTISTALHDDAEVVDTARWLAAATGFSLRLPR